MTESVRWGLDHPHPLSRLRTELVWEGKPFEHHRQHYRTRKERSVKTVNDAACDKCASPGVYTACVKVADVFGCDTSMAVEVRV